MPNARSAAEASRRRSRTSGASASRRASAPAPERVALSEARKRAIRKKLLAWGRAHFADYPWRYENQSPWISLATEVLLQRTRAEQVAAVYPEFVERYPEPALLARETPRRLLETVGRLGLHWRAPLMVKLAREIAEKGRPPEDPETLLALPGVGPYAAGAFLSFHRRKRAVIVDSNIVRWLGRMFGFPTDAESRRKRTILELAASLTPTRGFREFNYAVLDLSMKLCRPRPKCQECPFAPRGCHFARTLRGKP